MLRRSQLSEQQFDLRLIIQPSSILVKQIVISRKPSRKRDVAVRVVAEFLDIPSKGIENLLRTGCCARMHFRNDLPDEGFLRLLAVLLLLENLRHQIQALAKKLIRSWLLTGTSRNLLLALLLENGLLLLPLSVRNTHPFVFFHVGVEK